MLNDYKGPGEVCQELLKAIDDKLVEKYGRFATKGFDYVEILNTA
jgi:hypothetical protein